MTRSKVMTSLLKVFDKKSIIICVGTELVMENKFDDYPGFVGVGADGVDYLAVALGIAMVSKLKVVVLCDDAYLLAHLSTLCQIGVSECTNLYIIFFRTGSYCSELLQPTIVSSLRSVKGILFNAGVLVHDYTPYFKDARSIKTLGAIFNKSLGPMVAGISINNLRLYNNKDLTASLDSFKKYLMTVINVII